VKSNCNRFVHYCMAAAISLSPIAHAEPVHKKESRRDRLLQHMDHDRHAPPDFGFGANVVPPGGLMWKRATSGATPAFAPKRFASNATAVPSGGPGAGTNGMFGPVLPWPIIPIHMGLLPDGRVISYGSDDTGAQTGQIIYDVWDPSQGNGVNSHLVLPNQTNTDIFCSGLGLLTDGTLLLTGGDTTIDGARSSANNNVIIFDPTRNVLNFVGNMLYARWYPSVVPLPAGTALIAGGLGYVAGEDPTVLRGIGVPELYDPLAGLSALPGAENGQTIEWYYPKIFVSPNGIIYNIDVSGTISTYSTDGTGGFQMLGPYLSEGFHDVPTVMFAPGQLLSIRQADTITDTTQSHTVNTVDLTGDLPVVTSTASVPGGRQWANATLLADGKVFVNGGSGEENQLVRVSYDSYIWDRATGGWTLGGTAANFRLYHSAALLLPDGSVLTGGGGASGPVNHLNVEIYYPPYL
jgi:hypothetical protein